MTNKIIQNLPALELTNEDVEYNTLINLGMVHSEIVDAVDYFNLMDQLIEESEIAKKANLMSAYNSLRDEHRKAKEYFTKTYGNDVNFILISADHRKIELTMAPNADVEPNDVKTISNQDVAEALAKKLGIPQLPKRIEIMGFGK